MIEDSSSANDEITNQLELGEGDEIIVLTKQKASHRGAFKGVSKNLNSLILTSPLVLIPWDNVDYIQKYVEPKPAQVRANSVLPHLSIRG